VRRPGHLVAAGRDCDIFECGAGLVLRRSRLGRSLAAEAAVMDFVRAQDYRVPAVEDISDDGTDLVLERIDGPTMARFMELRPWTIRRQGAVLAGLHHRLHNISAPNFVPLAPVGSGDRLVHLDLHPLNVIIGPAGPVVIDWTNAARGDPAADVGLAWLLVAAGEIPASAWKRRPLEYARRAFLDSFLAGVDRPTAGALLAQLVEWKSGDPNMSPNETRRMRQVAESASLRARPTDGA
jgi:phosphotransferase family enzyme